ncbi:MAG: L-2-hydroxyglutarate oxidase [Pirellulales bacterium]|nr:L-2-hydroxyglutarate oxidase [Pirellulales bacterium]
MHSSDLIIIGGGIVGLATAYQFSDRFPGRRVMVLEKESDIAQHQTGHNSGVLHSGIYYRPGSLKAANCRDGKQAIVAFCRREGIPFDICGKVIVAVDDMELPALERIFKNGQANGVQCSLISGNRLAELEPFASGVRAIHVPETGIVDFVAVCRRFAERILERNGQVVTSSQVVKIHAQPDSVVIESTTGDYRAEQAINCGGLYCDRIAKQSGQRLQATIVPFRGEYYELKQEAHHLVHHLIYPVPNPAFPFLGVHFTRMIRGGYECGPNAVLAFAREGYRKTDFNLRDLIEAFTYSGFIRLALRHWRIGSGEMWRSISKQAFVRALQRLVPAIQSYHLKPAPAGVRAQAIARNGLIVDDFLIEATDRLLHVVNAPSPAATASLNIGRLIVERIASRFA